MPLPNNGLLSLRKIAEEFGGTDPIKFSNYYKGGAFVGAEADAPNVPNSGTLRFSNFYGAAKTRLWAIDLSPQGVVYRATPSFMEMPPGWYRQTIDLPDREPFDPGACLIRTPPPAELSDSENIHVVAVDIRMTQTFHDNDGLHFVVGSRIPDVPYQMVSHNRCGAVIGGGIFTPGYYGIEGVELAADGSNTFPWVWENDLLPNVWWRVVIVTKYADLKSYTRAMLFDEYGTKIVDTPYFDNPTLQSAFSTASVQHGVVMAHIFGATDDEYFDFKNVKAYWMKNDSVMPSHP